MSQRRPRTSTLKKHLALQADAKLRFTQRDRAFLKDLAKVRMVDINDALTHHYQGKLDSCKQRLKKLVDIGLLRERTVIQPGQPITKAYEFANDKVARKYGGRASGIGSRRSEVHELLVSKSYFALNRPEDFKVGAEMTHLEKEALIGSDGITPDAYFTHNGHLLFVEADAGQYTKKQVMNKQRNWAGIDQIWVQPKKANCVVPTGKNVSCIRL